MLLLRVMDWENGEVMGSSERHLEVEDGEVMEPERIAL